MTLRNRLLGLLLFAMLLVIAPSALAVDGVVLINQNTSVSGLPGCPHAGLPIVICQSGSYRLTGNLTIPNANTDGIDINADNVTLDLNGFAISGPVKCTAGTYPVQCSATGSGTGVLAVDKNNITVRNGTVRGMGDSGIAFRTFSSITAGALIENLHVYSNGGATGAGITVAFGVVTHCTVDVNAGHGISGGGVVTANTVTFNGGDGIAASGTVYKNTVGFNGQDGISGGPNAVNNTVFGNNGFGISANRYSGNLISFAGNSFGAVNGGISLGNNTCNNVVC